MCAVYVKEYVLLTLVVGIQVGVHITAMAEAAAVIGLVASIATLVELTAKVVSRLHEFASESEVPESFRSLSTRLTMLTAILQQIQSQAEGGRLPDDTTNALKAVVDDTLNKWPIYRSL